MQNLKILTHFTKDEAPDLLRITDPTSHNSIKLQIDCNSSVSATTTVQPPMRPRSTRAAISALLGENLHAKLHYLSNIFVPASAIPLIAHRRIGSACKHNHQNLSIMLNANVDHMLSTYLPPPAAARFLGYPRDNRATHTVDRIRSLATRPMINGTHQIKVGKLCKFHTLARFLPMNSIHMLVRCVVGLGPSEPRK